MVETQEPDRGFLNCCYGMDYLYMDSGHFLTSAVRMRLVVGGSRGDRSSFAWICLAILSAIELCFGGCQVKVMEIYEHSEKVRKEKK